jgi:hypothetical protein
MWMFKTKPSGQVDSAARKSATVFAVIATPVPISTLISRRDAARLVKIDDLTVQSDV